MSMKRVSIIDNGANIGDWSIRVNDTDIADMVESVNITLDRATRKPQVLIVLSPETLTLPKVLQAETNTRLTTKDSKTKGKSNG